MRYRVLQLASAALLLLILAQVPARAQQLRCPAHGDCVVANLVKAAIAAAATGHGNPGASNARLTVSSPIDDDALAERVTQALRACPDSQIRRIHVDAKDGFVELDGVVQSLMQKNLADDIASTIAGVRGIRSQVSIRPAGCTVDCNYFNTDVSVSRCDDRMAQASASANVANCYQRSSDSSTQVHD